MTDDEFRFEIESETVVIDGEEYELENSIHVIRDGVEYLVLDDEYYPLDEDDDFEDEDDDEEDFEDDFDYEPEFEDYVYNPNGSVLTTIVKGIFLIIVVGLVVYGGFFVAGMVTSDGVSSTISGASDKVASGVESAAEGLDELIDKTTTSSASKNADLVVEAMDYKNPVTRDFALMQIDSSHGGKYNIAQICDIWEKIYDKWTYVNDPNGFNYYSPSSRTIDLGLKGDCDDFAILVGSVMQSIGGSPRIILAQNDDGGGHAYAEVRVASSKQGLENIGNYICKRYKCKSIAYHTTYDSAGKPVYWLNLDWQSRHPGGKYYDNDGKTLVVYPDGHFTEMK